MRRDTLLDFFEDRIRSGSPFLVHDDGYRPRRYTYDEIRDAARVFAGRLATAGVNAGDKVVIWGENRPEWIAAFWGCLLARVVVVPVDYRTSAELLTRVIDVVEARVVLVGAEAPSLASTGPVRQWRLAELLPTGTETTAHHGPNTPRGPVASSDLAEIIFTSGATADPKGVTITHGNVLANLVPVECEILKYRKYGRPFYPLRFLNLLPLSHMFGQAMATLIPPTLQAVTVFMRGYNPSDIVRQIQRERVSVLVCVPKILDVLRTHILTVAPETGELPSVKPHVAVRWWRYRRIHKMFGFKFWAFVVGAAPLDPELEEFWSSLGFLVIQGYGLTETAPIVTLNHPFHSRQGSVGTPIGGVEVKIADDGEILVRGENVTGGYYNAPDETAAVFKDGWFHTGDIGAVDDTGRLSVRGRKKEVIVTPEGLNVFPEDVERAVGAVDGVRDVAVVGVTTGGEERVHAIVVLEPGVDPANIQRQANSGLEDHQKVRGCSVWPETALPRTGGTQKLKRREVRRWVEEGMQSDDRPRRTTGENLDTVLQRFVPDRAFTDETTIDELGLSSIERIELMMAIERSLDRTVDEASFAAADTVGTLRTLVAADAGLPETGPASHDVAHDFPTWSGARTARLVRRVALPGFLLPLTRAFAWTTVEGLDNLKHAPEPVVYAANHQSHMDGPVILAAMPAGRRYRVATAAAKEFFSGHFHPERHTRRERITGSVNYYLGSLFFHVFPLPQREAGAREAIRYLGERLSEGTSVLIFPEGLRTETGEIGPFQPGIGMIGSRLGVPIVPVRIEGVDRILHQKWRMAKPGRARVAFGAPLRLEGDDYPALAARVEAAVRAL